MLTPQLLSNTALKNQVERLPTDTHHPEDRIVGKNRYYVCELYVG